MQLVAYGAQDVYLTGNPQITFFKVVYRRHTNFACEAIEQTFNGSPALGGRATVPITRNGDLVTKMWLKTKIATTDTLTDAAKSSTVTAQYVLGTAGTDITAGDDGLTNLDITNSGDGEITVTDSDTNDLITAAKFPVGSVARLQDAGDYTGYYTVKTAGDDNVVVLNALSVLVLGTVLALFAASILNTSPSAIILVVIDPNFIIQTSLLMRCSCVVFLSLKELDGMHVLLRLNL